jgi:hypothetical protein
MPQCEFWLQLRYLLNRGCSRRWNIATYVSFLKRLETIWVAMQGCCGSCVVAGMLTVPDWLSCYWAYLPGSLVVSWTEHPLDQSVTPVHGSPRMQSCGKPSWLIRQHIRIMQIWNILRRKINMHKKNLCTLSTNIASKQFYLCYS